MLLRKNAPKDFLTKRSIHTDCTTIMSGMPIWHHAETHGNNERKAGRSGCRKSRRLVFNCTETHIQYGKVSAETA
jgi:hypothetical protein